MVRAFRNTGTANAISLLYYICTDTVKPTDCFSRRPGILNIYYSAAYYVTFFLKKYPFLLNPAPGRFDFAQRPFGGVSAHLRRLTLFSKPTRTTNTPLTHIRAVAERSRSDRTPDQSPVIYTKIIHGISDVKFFFIFFNFFRGWGFWGIKEINQYTSTYALGYKTCP